MSSDEVRTEMRVLLIDDDPDVRVSIGDYLSARGHRVYPADSGTRGLEILQGESIDIVITDIKMPGMDGFEVLREVREASPDTDVIMVTGYGDIEAAVQAMREGAFDFFTKPLKMQELSASLERTVRFHALRRERDRVLERLDRIGAEARRDYGLSTIIGGSAAIREVRRLIRQVCETDTTTVLICGETGTGKDVVARAIHYESTRAGGPFVAVDCTAIPEALAESAFYGHEKGAFTDARESRSGYFEQADGGTLFLDEVGEMDIGMQARLLRTLAERRVRRVGGTAEIPVDVRVVSATNRDLPEAIAQGRFREDLYYRLNTFAIQISPLRERPEDIPPLARHFLGLAAREVRKPIDGFAPEAVDYLLAHPFPGNVRELKNTIEHAAILCEHDRIAPGDLQFAPAAAPQAERSENGAPPVAGPPPDLRSMIRMAPEEDLDLSRLEEEAIREALRRCEGNRGRAAELLGLSRFALRRRMAQYDILNS